MIENISTKTDDIEIGCETESFIANNSDKIRMSDDQVENCSIVYVSTEKVVRHSRAVTDPLTQQLAQFCEFIHKLENEQPNRRQDETSSFTVARLSSRSGNRSDKYYVSIFRDIILRWLSDLSFTASARLMLYWVLNETFYAAIRCTDNYIIKHSEIRHSVY